MTDRRGERKRGERGINWRRKRTVKVKGDKAAREGRPNLPSSL